MSRDHEVIVPTGPEEGLGVIAGPRCCLCGHDPGEFDLYMHTWWCNRCRAGQYWDFGRPVNRSAP
jgi:hypothetical protein